ncbi:SLAM family member 9-like isoform X2 [Canis lupus familiaris]|uniref:SLAM family member 9-like isoform X2 n=1 Tax=Canis lupus familiaris TaxID=9615 RepID=UPI0015F18607|nr:SLAM family member 9-like isoform X2 [Canis lupus familiaris]XP_038527697.1 SLAM family member 9-like isoform X2 [Canis lupus familiaris]
MNTGASGGGQAGSPDPGCLAAGRNPQQGGQDPAGVGSPGTQSSGNAVSLKGMQGASVSFHVIRNPDLPPVDELEKISWGIVFRSNYIVMLQVFPGADVPEWVNWQDKFQKRVHVFNITTLRIDNLTLEDTGLYRARDSYTRGRQYDQDFHLTVYEPLPLPQIRTTNLSITPGWCNVTVQCDAPGTREDLTMSWESKGLPRELEQREATGPAPNPWTLALSLPLNQPNASLTCVLRNQVDQTTATLDLGDICGHNPQGQSDADHLPGILVTVVVLLLILGAGLFLWRRGVKKSLEPGRGAGSQEEHRDPMMASTLQS